MCHERITAADSASKPAKWINGQLRNFESLTPIIDGCAVRSAGKVLPDESKKSLGETSASKKTFEWSRDPGHNDGIGIGRIMRAKVR